MVVSTPDDFNLSTDYMESFSDFYWFRSFLCTESSSVTSVIDFSNPNIFPFNDAGLGAEDSLECVS